MSLPLTDDLGVIQTVTNGTPVYWNNGLGYDVNGLLCTTTTVDPSDVFIGGKRRSVNGSLVIADPSAGGQPYFYNAGWPSDKNTGATIAQSGTPVDTDPRVAGIAIAIAPDGGVYMLSGGGGFSPLDLFANGEPGFWYDPSDLVTMFQDSAGTTPMAPVGTVADQPVGRILDKSGNDIHAFQATSTARPLLSARVNLLLGTDVLSTQNVTVTAKAYKITFGGTGTVTASGAFTGALTNGQTFTPTAGTLTLTVAGSVTTAQLTTGVIDQPYQRVTTVSNYDGSPSKFPPYLKFDTIDDCLATAAFPMGASGKVTVFAGSANSKTASAGTLLEFSPIYLNNVGGFAVLTPSLATSHISFGSNGGAAGEKETQDPPSGALRKRVITVANTFATTLDYGCDYIRFQGINIANLVGAGNTDVGAGPYGTFAANIGARNNGTGGNFLGGYIYSLICAGNIYDTPTLVQMEEWIDAKMNPNPPTPPVTGILTEDDGTTVLYEDDGTTALLED